MPRPMYFASFAKKVFLRAPGFRGYVAGTRRWCAGRVCGAQLVFCQRPDHGEWRHAASSGNKRTGEVGGAERDVRRTKLRLEPALVRSISDFGSQPLNQRGSIMDMTGKEDFIGWETTN